MICIALQSVHPAVGNLTVPVIETTIDGNTEHSSASQELPSVPKIKFTVSSSVNSNALINGDDLGKGTSIIIVFIDCTL